MSDGSAKAMSSIQVSKAFKVHEPAEPTEPSMLSMKAGPTRLDTLLSQLSPLQRDIVKLLAEGPKTAAELSERLGSTPDSIRKRLSQLKHFHFGEEIAPMVEVAIDRPPKRYKLAAWMQQIVESSSYSLSEVGGGDGKENMECGNSRSAS